MELMNARRRMPIMPNWDERYRNGEHTNREPLPLLIRVIKDLNPGRALDLACGVGRHAIYLAQHDWRVTAIDSSQVGIEILRERAGATRLSIDAQVADLQKHDFTIQTAAYDLIC